jgi:hypothetical protein
MGILWRMKDKCYVENLEKPKKKEKKKRKIDKEIHSINNKICTTNNPNTQFRTS